LPAGRPRGDRGQRITVTAARLFREQGFHATSIDDIGRAEGISGGAIYRHIHLRGPGGQEVELVARARRPVSGAVAPGVDPECNPVRLPRPVRVADREVLLALHLDRQPQPGLVPPQPNVGKVGRPVHVRERVKPGRFR